MRGPFSTNISSKKAFGPCQKVDNAVIWLNMNEISSGERRGPQDRRRKPTPGLSRYTFFGRRGNIRRKEETERGGYVDRYSPALFFFLILVLGLNVLDALFTLMILDRHGWEVNPVVRSVIQLHGTQFWIWKFAVVSTCLVMLCLHSKFRRVKAIIVGISTIYVAVILYQIYLLTYL